MSTWGKAPPVIWNIEGAEVALVPAKSVALYLQPQVDAVGADRLIQYAIERHLVLRYPAPGSAGQNGLAARIQQGDRLPFTS